MKTFLKIGAVVVLLIVVVLAVLSFYVNAMIKAGVEAVGPKITGTTMKLDAVDLSPLSGQARLKGLVVGNPQGFQTESSFKLADAKVKVDLKTALSDKLIIEEILIDGPEITYEGSSSGSNISKIQENVAAFGKKAGAQGGAEPKAEKKEPGKKKVQINHFIVKNARLNVSASMFKGKSLTVPMPDIHLKDIGKESGGMTSETAAAEVFAAINKSVIQSVSGALEKGAEAVGEAAKSAGSEVEKAGSKAVEGVKGLFGK